LYWHSTKSVLSLPKKLDPQILSSEELLHDDNRGALLLLFGEVDSDWSGDRNHRKSGTGIILQLAGDTILYKTKYQDTIVFSRYWSRIYCSSQC
jgi:hypothetical protein